jgi:hypothetical protein
VTPGRDVDPTPKPVQFRDSAVQADKLAPRLITQSRRKGEPTVARPGCRASPSSWSSAATPTTATTPRPSPWSPICCASPGLPAGTRPPSAAAFGCLAQEYALPTRAEETAQEADESGAAGDPMDDADPALQAAAGLDAAVQFDEPEEFEEEGSPLCSGPSRRPRRRGRRGGQSSRSALSAVRVPSLGDHTWGPVSGARIFVPAGPRGGSEESLSANGLGLSGERAESRLCGDVCRSSALSSRSGGLGEVHA